VIGWPGNPAWFGRTRPARRSGEPTKIEDYPPERLNAESDAVFALRSLIVDYGRLALGLWMLVRDADRGGIRERRAGELRVGDVLTKHDGTVHRDGTKANLVDEF
jgi:hypothetical protein